MKRRLITLALTAGALLGGSVLAVSVFATRNLYGLHNDSPHTLTNVTLHTRVGQECQLGEIAPGKAAWVQPEWWKEADLHVSFEVQGQLIETRGHAVSPGLQAQTYEFGIGEADRLSLGGRATWWQCRRLFP